MANTTRFEDLSSQETLASVADACMHVGCLVFAGHVGQRVERHGWLICPQHFDRGVGIDNRSRLGRIPSRSCEWKLLGVENMYVAIARARRHIELNPRARLGRF